MMKLGVSFSLSAMGFGYRHYPSYALRRNASHALFKIATGASLLQDA